MAILHKFKEQGIISANPSEKASANNVAVITAKKMIRKLYVNHFRGETSWFLKNLYRKNKAIIDHAFFHYQQSASLGKGCAPGERFYFEDFFWDLVEDVVDSLHLQENVASCYHIEEA
ncbi:hypothetical protein ACLOJK_040344 [Asimina triloba]